MKLITAIIRVHKVDELKDKLESIKVRGITITHVEGYGRQKGQTSVYRGAEYTVDFVPKCKVEIACTDEDVDNLIDEIVDTCGSNKVGDGKIFVQTLDKVVRIRTSELDNDAL